MRQHVNRHSASDGVQSSLIQASAKLSSDAPPKSTNLESHPKLRLGTFDSAGSLSRQQILWSTDSLLRPRGKSTMLEPEVSGISRQSDYIVGPHSRHERHRERNRSGKVVNLK